MTNCILAADDYFKVSVTISDQHTIDQPDFDTHAFTVPAAYDPGEGIWVLTRAALLELEDMVEKLVSTAYEFRTQKSRKKSNKVKCDMLPELLSECIFILKNDYKLVLHENSHTPRPVPSCGQDGIASK